MGDMDVENAHAEHQRWLDSVYAQWGQRQGSTPSGSSHFGAPTLSRQICDSSALSRQGEGTQRLHVDPFAHLSPGYDEIVDDDDVPVYRSLSQLVFVDDHQTVEDELPVYRSLGELFTACDPCELGMPTDDRDDAPPADWLETMPPLVCRQRGRMPLE